MLRKKFSPLFALAVSEYLPVLTLALAVQQSRREEPDKSLVA